MLISKRRYQQMLDEHDTAIWYRDKRIRELEESLTAERVLRTTTDVKLDKVMQDNRNLLNQRDLLLTSAQGIQQQITEKDKQIRELKLRLGSIESRWGAEASI